MPWCYTKTNTFVQEKYDFYLVWQDPRIWYSRQKQSLIKLTVIWIISITLADEQLHWTLFSAVFIIRNIDVKTSAMRARSIVEQSGLVVATTFFFNSQMHHESQTAHTGYGSVTRSSPLDANTNTQKRWRIGTFNSVRTAVWRSAPLLYAASNPLWNPQMTLFNATQVVLCTVRCDTWELVVIRAIRSVTETPVMWHSLYGTGMFIQVCA